MCHWRPPHASLRTIISATTNSTSRFVFLRNDSVMASPKPAPTSKETMTKRCFVTVGATSSFQSLIRATLSSSFLEALQSQGYEELRIQYGKDGKKTFDDYLWVLSTEKQPKERYGIEVSGFDFDKTGLRGEMIKAREGCVVSHAGSGSILDALRVAAPLLVVPNSELMDNHQIELAEILEQQNYVVHGKLDDLASGVLKVENLRMAMQKWPPVTSGHKQGGLVKVVKEEMGWLD